MKKNLKHILYGISSSVFLIRFAIAENTENEHRTNGKVFSRIQEHDIA